MPISLTWEIARKNQGKHRIKVLESLGIILGMLYQTPNLTICYSLEYSKINRTDRIISLRHFTWYEVQYANGQTLDD
jgi:hypothetical protein